MLDFENYPVIAAVKSKNDLSRPWRWRGNDIHGQAGLME